MSGNIPQRRVNPADVGPFRPIRNITESRASAQRIQFDSPEAPSSRATSSAGSFGSFGSPFVPNDPEAELGAALDDYLSPSIGGISPLRALSPGALDMLEGLDLFGPDMAVPPRRTYALENANSRYGRSVFTVEGQNLASGGAGRVPIVSVAVDVDTDVNFDTYAGARVIGSSSNNQFGGLTFIDVLQGAYEDAYRRARISAGVERSDNDYVQMRLLADDNNEMEYDLTSDMAPVTRAIADFTAMYTSFSQSKRALDDVSFFRFRFTFVFANGRPQAVTPNNIAQALTISRDAVRDHRFRHPAIDADAARRRFLAQSIVGSYSSTAQAPPAVRQERRRTINVLTNRTRDPVLEDLATIAPLVSPRLGPDTTRQKRTLTREQMDRNNAAKRAKRAGPRPTYGIYDDIKRKIFHHSSLDGFLHGSKALDRVPNTWVEGHCLMMALMHSELRLYIIQSDRLEVYESPPQQNPMDTPPGYLYDIQEPYLHLQNKNSPFIEGRHIVMFNPYKKTKPRGAEGMKYDCELTAEEKQMWFQAACSMHKFVCRTVGEELDPNDESVLQHYSDVLGVHICVYRAECRGRRTKIFAPNGSSIDIRADQGARVVSILISDQHASAITHLRDFMKSNSTANRSNVYNYCLFCEKQSTANNETIESSQTHFISCCDAHNGKISCAGDIRARKKEVSTVTPPPFMRKKDLTWACRLCHCDVVGGMDGQMDHVCYIKKPDEFQVGLDSNLFVYDLECAQILDKDKGVFIHKVNLVCVRDMYPDENGQFHRSTFHNIEDFMQYVMSFSTEDRIYIAHNGGKYDVQFVMRYLEKNLIAHHFIPTPSSMHAYLSVTIPFGSKLAATFLDFRHFMPGSLKNIGISFGLSVAKGDFPHRFNNGHHDEYIGRLPPLDHEEDYWCLNTKKTQEDLDEFKAWYFSQSLIYCSCEHECTCDRVKWNFQVELERYCWLDVDVLGEACARYRNNALQFGVDEENNEGWVSKGIDPFQYLTIPQLALNLLLGGSPEEEKVCITLQKLRRERVPLAISWMERMSAHLGRRIQHIGNSNREYFCPKTKRYLDGITFEHQVYVCLQCEFHACPQCFYTEIEEGTDHPYRPGTYSLVNHDTRKFVTDLLKYYGTERTTIVWEHELTDYTEREIVLGDMMKERDMFYGGRTEVFSPYCNAERYENDEIKYHDVCSLYPYVCAFRRLPTGHPEHYFDRDIEWPRLCNVNHPNPYFGYVRCRVRPNKRDTLGLLPHRDESTGRLEFPLMEMTGSWGTEELRLAIENGYEILDIYEVYHWTEEESSDTLLRGYVSFFLRMKQEAEGWKKLGASSETPTAKEMLEVQSRVYRESGCIAKIRPMNVAKNPVKRQMAKLFLNSLWGKFCQKPHSEHYTVINGYQQFADLWYNGTVDRTKFSFRHIGGDTWKVKYSVFDDFARPNPKYNIFLSSKVTEWARCILHRQMIRISPERVLYCDTDSIMFIWPKDGDQLAGVGLGNWVDEYPDQRILRLFALAPKFYYLEFEGEGLLKSKGIQVNVHNSGLIHPQSLGKQLLEVFFPRSIEGVKQPFEGYLPMQNMLIGINAVNAHIEYGAMTTRYTQDKRLGPVFSKRQVVTYSQKANVQYELPIMYELGRIFTIPKGYFQTADEVAIKEYEYLNI